MNWNRKSITSEQDSESCMFTEDEEASEPTQTFPTHHIVNETTHDEEMHQKLKMIQ